MEKKYIFEQFSILVQSSTTTLRMVEEPTVKGQKLSRAHSDPEMRLRQHQPLWTCGDPLLCFSCPSMAYKQLLQEKGIKGYSTPWLWLGQGATNRILSHRVYAAFG